MKPITSIRTLCALPGFLFLTATLAPAQTVYNGSFEQGIGISSFAFIQINAVDSTSITGWTVSSGTVDYVSSGWWQAGDGNRSLDMNGINAGSIQQAIDGFTVGQSYQLSFLLAGNPNSLPAQTMLSASIGSVSQTYTFDSTGHSDFNMGWISEMMWFTATAPSMTLTFTSLLSGYAGPTLDSVAITTVPEPAALPLLGLVALSLGLRRRGIKRQSA